MVGVIGVDPGPTTGISWGLFNPDLRDRTSLWNAIAKGRGLGCVQIGREATIEEMGGVVPGDVPSAALMVAKRVTEKIAEWNIRGLAKSDIYICCEDYQLRGGGGGASAAPGANMWTGLGPVFISGVLYGALAGIGWGERIIYVQAGVHKPHANDARLKRLAKASRGRAGWLPGKKHARDSWRLLAWQFEQVV
jgi:hypothetical protein